MNRPARAVLKILTSEAVCFFLYLIFGSVFMTVCLSVSGCLCFYGFLSWITGKPIDWLIETRRQ